MKRNFTNTKMKDIGMWDFIKLRNTKEYQEKRKEFIEEKGGKCKGCGSAKYLNVSHPQQYLKIIYSKEKGKFYSVYYKLKSKEACPLCGFDKAYEDKIPYQRKVKHNKKYKFNYLCPSCRERYKYPERTKTDQLRIITELTNYQIPNTADHKFVCLRIQEKINKQQWKKYISFIDAEVLCRDCHYLDHFIPLTIINRPALEIKERGVN